MSRHASSFSGPSSPGQVLVGPQGTGKSAPVEQLATGQLGHVKEAEEASTELGAVTTVHQPSGTVVTLVDSPGRPDFVGDVRAGLRAADAVVFMDHGRVLEAGPPARVLESAEPDRLQRFLAQVL